MDQVIAAERARARSQRQLRQKVPRRHRLVNAGHLSGTSLQVAQHLNGLVLMMVGNGKRKRDESKAKGIKPTSPPPPSKLQKRDGGDDQDPMVIHPEDLPTGLINAPPEAVFEILLDVLDMRGLLDYWQDPVAIYDLIPEEERNIAWRLRRERAYFKRISLRHKMIAERARDLVATFRSLRSTSTQFLDTVMDPLFREQLYRRWYRFGSRWEAQPIRSVQEAEALPMPLRKSYLRVVGGGPEIPTSAPTPNWYLTLVYDAILYEHLMAVSESVMRGGDRIPRGPLGA